MNKTLLAIALACLANLATSATIASMPNQGGGKIVLTDEVCKIKDRTFPELYRLYMYTAEGLTSEGCYYVEDETIMAIWAMSYGVERRRYPISSFTSTRRNNL